MQLPILFTLIVLIFFLIEFGQIAAAAVVVLLIVADLIGGVASKTFSFFSGAISVISQTAQSEALEVEATHTKYPSGKKFFEEGFSKLGKGTGKGEKLKQEGKKQPEKFTIGDFAQGADNFLSGIFKLFKK